MGMDLQLGPGVSHPRRPIHQLHAHQSHSFPLAKPQPSWPMMYRTTTVGGARRVQENTYQIAHYALLCVLKEKREER